jgi:predicted MFS family arabinose efflux permease
MAGITELVKATKNRALDIAGGPARLQVILVLAAVLGLDTAQLGTLSAVSDLLKKAFHIGNPQIGMLIAVVQFVGAIATLPMGILADRMRRQYVLIVAVLVWAGAMVLSASATSYPYLLGTRAFLGAVTAVAWPCVASLTGDFFPARDRASIYGLILSGEMIGAGVGFFHLGRGIEFCELALVVHRHGRAEPAARLDIVALSA